MNLASIQLREIDHETTGRPGNVLILAFKDTKRISGKHYFDLVFDDLSDIKLVAARLRNFAASLENV